MPQNFLACDREQSFLLPPDVREWLPEDHLAWFVIDVVDVIDTAAFYAAHRADGHGRAAYEPSMMRALLLYCWSRGARSSRAIERACVEDVACRVSAAHQQPDHATVARVVERHERALAGLFSEVLALCVEAGLASVGVIAIDGTKVAANANRDRTMTFEQIAQAIVDEQIATDAAETARHTEGRGDDLPRDLETAEGRRGWLRAAAQQRADDPSPVPRSRAKRLLEGRRCLEEELDVERDAHARYEAYRARRMKDGRRFGRPPNPVALPDTPQGKVNITDPDSKLVHGMRRWVQGYNAQAVCNEQHVILAAEVMTASPDFGHLAPMVDATRRELAAAGATDRPRVVVPDAGYWHLDQMNAITADGIAVLIPPDPSRRKTTRPGWDGGAYDFMRSVLSTDRGNALYKLRGQLSSRSSATPNPTGALTASHAAEEPPPAPSGASSPPPTTSSGSTNTSTPAPPDGAGRRARHRPGARPGIADLCATASRECASRGLDRRASLVGELDPEAWTAGRTAAPARCHCGSEFRRSGGGRCGSAGAGEQSAEGDRVGVADA